MTLSCRLILFVIAQHSQNVFAKYDTDYREIQGGTPFQIIVIIIIINLSYTINTFYNAAISR